MKQELLCLIQQIIIWNYQISTCVCTIESAPVPAFVGSNAKEGLLFSCLEWVGDEFMDFSVFMWGHHIPVEANNSS